MKLMLLTSAATALLLATSCNKDEQDRLSQKDKDFMTKATYINLGEIYAGDTAKHRAIHAIVKDYGDMMITDHANAQQQLDRVGVAVEYPLPLDTDMEHKAMMQTLATLTGDAFDSTYMYKMVEGHDKAIALYDDEVANGTDRAVIEYAAYTAGTIRHHRMMADSIAHALYP